jgi:DNA-binding CsgD family transcriptional regulator
MNAEPPNEFQRYHRYQAAAALSRLVGAQPRARALLHSAHAEAEKLDDRVTRLYIAEALVATGEAGGVAELAARAEAMGLVPLASRLRAGISAGVIGSAEAGGAGAGPGARAPLAPAGAVLSAREIEIVRLMVQGLADKEIARRLEISAHTVSNHVRNIRRKTGTSNRMAAASVVRGWGLLQ